MRGLRNALPGSACAARSAKIVERLGSLDSIAAARAVALFWPIEDRHEVDLRSLDASLRARGVRVAYPALTEPTDSGRSMVFRFPGAPDAMVESPLGLREPPESAPPATIGDLDAIVVPALAIDPRGHRIGYGGGFYDRALASAAPHTVTIGVAYEFQLLAEIPQTEGDIAVRWVVTDARALPAEALSP
jgi:5-formyltetrahydrofolate cyclo-ligase